VTTRQVVERPQQIIQAIVLVWISTALGVGASLLEAQRGAESRAALVVTLIVMLGLLAALTVALWRGRNWARMLYLFLVATALAAFLAAWGTSERPRFEVALEAVSFVADGGSFFLMFTRPGSNWFRDTREQRA
jgi:hypothetical protein